MTFNSQDELLNAAESHKERVYGTIDALQASARQTVVQKKADVQRGAFEEHSAFMVYGALSGANNSLRETESLIAKLYKKPYFAHIEATESDSTLSEHFYLSDCEALDTMLPIGTDGALLPFKLDKERPISAALFHCYQSKKGESVSYTGPGGQYTLIPILISDDEIENRYLVNATLLYPETELLQISADVLLEERIQENRNNPTLRNIISTLQRKQFVIIEADADTSFIVQGCAGSGKSQCLLHRLFYLRDTLSQVGWNHVLLITPTQLFRHYSAELIRRYQLSSIENYSVAELYRILLNKYDQRFRNRQYRYELTEEYLPDGYLREVYDRRQISRIDSEIIDAIQKYVQDACHALSVDMPLVITAKEINEILRQLEEAVKTYDLRETALQKDEEYVGKREHYEQLLKKIDNHQKRYEKLLAEKEQMLRDRATVEQLQHAAQKAEAERNEWLSQREKIKRETISSLRVIVALWNTSDEVQLPAKYAQGVCAAQNLLEGPRFISDEEYLHFLDDYCSQANKELQEALDKMPTGKKSGLLPDGNENFTTKIEALQREIEMLTAQADEYEVWLRNRIETTDSERSKITIRRSEMERARYFLSRIESTVFEQEVWKALTPLKERYQIKALQVENLPDGRQREIRILYKSDLLFYLKIYFLLYPSAVLPDYRMICIDEGQDLHQADYEMIHKLYPKAVLNIFGDTEQVLHNSCGISDWGAETGINTLYTLNRNYRNTAAIVDFCNRSLGSSMEYIGAVKKSQQPQIINEISNLVQALKMNGIVLIVKDIGALEQLCKQMNRPVSDFEYLDTKVPQVLGGKIPCYSIFAAKGLEFTNAVIYASGMTKNQKVVACTRAMEVLYYYE